MTTASPNAARLLGMTESLTVCEEAVLRGFRQAFARRADAERAREESRLRHWNETEPCPQGGRRGRRASYDSQHLWTAIAADDEAAGRLATALCSAYPLRDRLQSRLTEEERAVLADYGSRLRCRGAKCDGLH